MNKENEHLSQVIIEQTKNGFVVMPRGLARTALPLEHGECWVFPDAESLGGWITRNMGGRHDDG